LSAFLNHPFAQKLEKTRIRLSFSESITTLLNVLSFSNVKKALYKHNNDVFIEGVCDRGATSLEKKLFILFRYGILP